MARVPSLGVKTALIANLRHGAIGQCHQAPAIGHSEGKHVVIMKDGSLCSVGELDNVYEVQRASIFAVRRKRNFTTLLLNETTQKGCPHSLVP